MLSPVDIPDLIDLIGGSLPRRAQRLIALAFMLLLSASTAASLVIWYAAHKAQTIVQQFDRVVAPVTPTPTSPSSPP